MSYDFWMKDPDSEAPLTDSENHTSNTSKMMEVAMGIPFRDLHGKTGAEALPWLLDGAVALLDDFRLFPDMPARNDRFREHEAPNGWGTVESTAFFLVRCARRAAKEPNGVCMVGA